MTKTGEMKQTACAILLRDGRILLGRRTPQRRFYPDCWDVLGGHLEAGETPEQALIREVQEEAGVTPLRHRLIATLPDPDPVRNGEARYHVFIVTGWTEASRGCWATNTARSGGSRSTRPPVCPTLRSMRIATSSGRWPTRSADAVPDNRHGEP